MTWTGQKIASGSQLSTVSPYGWKITFMLFHTLLVPAVIAALPVASLADILSPVYSATTQINLTSSGVELCRSSLHSAHAPRCNSTSSCRIIHDASTVADEF